MGETATEPKLRLRWYQYRLVHLFVVVTVSAILFGWMFYTVYPQRAYLLHIRSVSERIRSLHNQRPGNITPERWEEAVDWACTAFVNLPLDRAQREDFDSGLRERMADGDSLETLRWIWDELTRSTPNGPAYAAEFCPVRAMTPEPITDQTLKSLWGADLATCLDLGDTEVGDAGLIHLSSTQNLDTLNLTSTRVTDTGLQHLRGLTKLKLLYLNGTQVTDDGVKELQEALPNCEIEY